MDVDGTPEQLLGPEQHAALRTGVFWCDPPGSQSQVPALQNSAPGVGQQRRHNIHREQEQQQGGVSEEANQIASSAAAEVEAGAGGQQAEGSFMYGGGGGTVLLFEAGDPCPRGAWLLPR